MVVLTPPPPLSARVHTLLQSDHGIRVITCTKYHTTCLFRLVPRKILFDRMHEAAGLISIEGSLEGLPKVEGQGGEEGGGPESAAANSNKRRVETGAEEGDEEERKAAAAAKAARKKARKVAKLAAKAAKNVKNEL